ncbi:MAG TPA: family 1 glycosylhydrolase [Candidatus Fimivicinus intestinavium]|nr:family 1 glycosylhydrolase [Candidatus Fimivicinus intestinavium]
MQKGFSKDFLWGAATSAAQIEGGFDCGGRSPSIWDAAPKEKIKDGADCHTACDHFHRFREDVAIMKELGLKSYRFSVSWSRVVSADGVVNRRGLDFYSALVDELRKNNIEPLVTLYHWDLPLWQYEKGGWLNEAVIDDFQFYVKTVVEALSDRVTYWVTFNEPSCFLMNGYMQGVHAPFKRKYLALPKFTKIFMRANQKAVETIRRHAKITPKIGLSFAAGAFIPDHEEDTKSVEEAYRKSFHKTMGTMNNRWWMDPILLGKPVSAYGIYRTRERDMKNCKADLDFLAINNYEAFNYSAWGGDKGIDRSKLKTTAIDWVIDGRSIYWTLRFLYKRYRLPIMITENGMANDDRVQNGEVKDDIRAEFMDEYLFHVHKAICDGVPVLGYQHWSLLDNFEWAEGYGPRFGLVYVDYKTQSRIIKNSAYHYKKIIETDGECIL